MKVIDKCSNKSSILHFVLSDLSLRFCLKTGPGLRAFMMSHHRTENVLVPAKSLAILTLLVLGDLALIKKNPGQ